MVMANNEFSVILEKVGNQPLKTTKILCQVLGLGLAAAKAMVDKAPTTVATGMDRDKALALRDELEAIGNTVSIPGVETSTFTTTKKDTEPKKSTAKKSVPTPLTVATPSNDDFDAIFGGGTVKKTTAPTKTNDSAKSTQKAAMKCILMAALFSVLAYIISPVVIYVAWAIIALVFLILSAAAMNAVPEGGGFDWTWYNMRRNQGMSHNEAFVDAQIHTSQNR